MIVRLHDRRINRRRRDEQRLRTDCYRDIFIAIDLLQMRNLKMHEEFIGFLSVT